MTPTDEQIKQWIGIAVYEHGHGTEGFYRRLVELAQEAEREECKKACEEAIEAALKEEREAIVGVLCALLDEYPGIRYLQLRSGIKRALFAVAGRSKA
jgi:hypothetical protein